MCGTDSVRKLYFYHDNYIASMNVITQQTTGTDEALAPSAAHHSTKCHDNHRQHNTMRIPVPHGTVYHSKGGTIRAEPLNGRSFMIHLQGCVRIVFIQVDPGRSLQLGIGLSTSLVLTHHIQCTWAERTSLTQRLNTIFSQTSLSTVT